MIKYVGKKHLNSNLYKSISIIEKGDGNVYVNTYPDEVLKKVNSLKTNTKSITEVIENLDDYDKIEKIISYYLRNNSINSLDSNDGISITSTSSRKLVLRLSKKYQPIVRSIIEKYENDRLQYIYSIEYENLYIQLTDTYKPYHYIDNVSNYYYDYCKYDNEGALVLTLLTNKKKIASYDKNFIIKYIEDIINSCDKEIRIVKLDEFEMLMDLSGKIIRIPEVLIKEVYILVCKRNNEINDINNKQLKLEVNTWKH